MLSAVNLELLNREAHRMTGFGAKETRTVVKQSSVAR